MQKITLKIFTFFALFIFFGQLKAEVNQLKFDSSAKGRQDKNVAPEEQIAATHNRQKEEKAGLLTDRFTEAGSEEGVRNLLSKYEIILAREKRPEKVIPIEFNRVICYIDLARAVRVKNGGKNVGTEEKEYLQNALNLIDKLLNIKNLKKPLISQLYFFQGVTYLDLEEKLKSRKSLETAIEIYSKSRFVPSLSLYLADIDYDAGALVLAEKMYRKFYSDMKPDEKGYSDYKVAWIKLNQSNIDAAVNLFLKIIRESKSKSIVQDSILSVSLALSEKYSESYILDIVDKYQIPDIFKLRIFWSIYDIFLKNPLKEKFEIWDRILKYEKDQEALFRLMSAGLQSVLFKDQMSKETILVEKIFKYIQSRSQVLSKVKSNSKDLLGEDFEVLIVKSLNIYQKNKDKLAYKILRHSIEAYLLLDIKSRKVDIMSLYLELLIEEQDDNGLMKLCQKILLNRDLVPLRNRAKLLVLLNFEKKFLASPSVNQNKFFKLIDSYLMQKDADQWENVADKYFNYLIKANKLAEAEALAMKIYHKFSNEKNFVRILSIKYEAKKCIDVIELIDKSNYTSKETVEYKRECHLILAEESKLGQKSEEQYRKNIVEFIGLSEGKKKTAAISDYLKNLESMVEKYPEEESQKNQEFNIALQKTFYSYRFEPEIFPIYHREIIRLLESGDFKLSSFYLQDCSAQVICSPLKEVSTQLNSVKELDLQTNLSTHNADIFKNNLNYIVLFNPEIIIENCLNGCANNNNIDLNVLSVAAKLIEIDWQDSKYKKIYERIKDTLSPEEHVYLYTNSWLKLLKTKVPEISKRHVMSDQDVLYLITKVQNARKAIKNELDKLSLENQVKILSFAETVEKNMANVIKFSPIPKNLEKTKIPEYQSGLDQLADEFIKQSALFKEMVNVVEGKIKEKSLKNISPSETVRIVENVNNWDWGSFPNYNKVLINMINSKQFYQSLYFLDFLFSNNKITKDEYFQKRTGVLLNSATLRKKTKSMYSYIINELVAEKLDIIREQLIKGTYYK